MRFSPGHVFSSLASRLVGLTIVVGLLAGSLVGIVALQQTRSVMRDEILRRSLATADLASALTAEYFAQTEADARELAARPGVQHAMASSDFSQVNVDLERWLPEHPQVQGVAAFDVNGNAVAAARPDSLTRPVRADSDWLIYVSRTNQPVLGGPGIGQVRGTPRIPYAVPLDDGDGNFRAVLMVSISLDNLSNTLHQANVGENARISLIDVERNVVLASVDPSRLLQPSARSSAAAHLLAGERGALETQATDSEAQLAAFEPVRGGPWGIVIEQPSTDAFASLQDLSRTLLELVVVAVGLSVIAGVLMAVHISRPLRTLRAATNAMADGHLGLRTGIGRSDEIGQLARSFDHMATSLERQHRERLVAEAALHASEARYRDLVELSPVPIAVHADGRYVYANPAAARLLGVASPDGLVGLPVAQTLPPGERALLGGAAVPSDGLPVEQKLLRLDGQLIDTELVGLAIEYQGQPATQIVLRDVTDQKRVQAALAHQANHDGLTGLPNRVLLHSRLQEAIDIGESFGLCILDLDGFKEINDTLGHDAGDVLLREVARRLSRGMRPGDLVARLGGDEFALLLHNVEVSVAVRTAEQLGLQLAHGFEINGQRLDIRASVGIAMHPTHGQDPATLLRRADMAMYVAKRAHARCTVFAPELDRDSAERLTLLSDLRAAIDTDQLVLYYQPKQDLRRGLVTGAEALVRWQRPGKGLIAPDKFIPLAEQTGLIGPLTDWVMHAAVRQACIWQRRYPDMRVAINLSMRNLQDPTLADTIAGLLEQWPARLDVEITESALMADPERALATLSALSDLGVRIAIDDFGTGYSSLAYLKRLPVDVLKIDRSFVRDLQTFTNDRIIVRSTIDLAHNLGLRVVAEGVEDSIAAEVLRQFGCDEIQGYHLSRPVPASDFERWLASWSQAALVA
jgi:diguanylate cyclase (GGDEF)-like protein/PAS domain S-box-containing protein